MTGLLMMGLLIGMRHALEADHIAAVASLCSSGESPSYAIRQGIAWGIGHTLMLLLFGAAVMLMGLVLSSQLAAGLEALVGCMLVLLGVDLLRRLYRKRNGNHGGERPACHQHQHRDAADRFPVRALLVGLMHGMAGSAALVMLTLQTVSSPPAGIAYILLFGVGSILGMVLVSTVIAFPLRRLRKRRIWLYNGLQLLIGCSTTGLGALIVYQSQAALLV